MDIELLRTFVKQHCFRHLGRAADILNAERMIAARRVARQDVSLAEVSEHVVIGGSLRLWDVLFNRGCTTFAVPVQTGRLLLNQYHRRR